MRVCLTIAALLCTSVSGFGADATATVDDGTTLRAKNELTRVQSLVEAGVLPRARLEQAQNALADAQDDHAIRTLLYKQEISIDEAEQLVSLTTHRVGRCQGVVEAKTKLLEAGIIARDEMAGDLANLAQAQSQRTWALSRQQTANELLQLAKSEQEAMRQMEMAMRGHAAPGLVEHFVGSNHFDLAELPMIQKAFEARFAKPLPVSAMGETEVHKSLGFDHRNRVDIALPPELPEGRWLRGYLTAHNIPFFAFSSAVSRQATGAHIHIGPPSLHYLSQAASRGRTTAGED